MLGRILNIAWKDMLHLWHNRALLIMVIFGAACELLLVGWATGAEVDDLKTVVIDHDQTPISQGLIEALGATKTLTLNGDAIDDFTRHDDRDAALDDIFTGGNFIFNPDNVLLVEIPAEFGDQVCGEVSDVSVSYDLGCEARMYAESPRLAKGGNRVVKGEKPRFRFYTPDMKENCR